MLSKSLMRFSLIGLCLIGLSGIFACSEDDVNDLLDADYEDAAMVTAVTLSAASQAAMLPAGVQIGDQARADTTYLFTSYTNGCPVVASIKDGLSRALLINYGAGCTSSYDSLYHSGRVMAAWTRGSTTGTMTLTDFTLEGTELDGTLALSFNWTSSSLGMNGNCTALNTDNETFAVAVNITAAYSLNGTTQNPTDDTVTVNGTSAVTDASSKTYNTTMTSLRFLGWYYIPVSGTMVVSTTNPPLSATVDFGDGTQDTIVEVTIAGQSETIDLAEYF